MDGYSARARGAWRCWVADSAAPWWEPSGSNGSRSYPTRLGTSGYHGYVSSVYVTADRRGAGIGSALLAACLAQCEAEAIDAVFLWPTELSRSLYQRHGFAVRDDLLERRFSAAWT